MKLTKQLKIKRTPIAPDIKKSDYNNNNLHEYDPYIIRDGVVIIDKRWFVTLNLDMQSFLSDLTNDFDASFGNVEIPHPLCEDIEGSPLVKIYQAYLDSFDYTKWYFRGIPNGPVVSGIIPLDGEDKKILSEMYLNHKNTTNDITDKRLDCFKSKINCVLKDGSKYFIRLSSTSGKNFKTIRPMESVDDIITHLTSVKQFNDQEYTRDKDTRLIIIPWNDNIEKRYEFRIFVVNNKLTGASQQWWSQLFNYTTEELDGIEHALNNIAFINHITISTYVADVYIEVDTADATKSVCKLIELNAFGAHCGAGSNLFNWITDYDKLHGKSNKNNKNTTTSDGPEMRYLSVIKI